MNVYVFSGPTTYGIQSHVLDQRDFFFHPPVRRGDVQRLIDENLNPSVIAIVDGTFHSYPSVGHREIKDAILKGWQVWGVASMGAIRAAEMQPLGMKGYGAVFQQYIRDEDFSDDEVTLVHQLDAPYLPVSEPMIHIRECLSDLQARSDLTVEQEGEITENLKLRWYGERTLKRLGQQLSSVGRMNEEAIQTVIASFSKYRVKTKDFTDFLEKRPWVSGVWSERCA